MNQEKIGKFIQNLRKEKGLTQRELAEKLNISNRAVSKWENGTSMPDLSLFKPLCEILDITINELYDGEKNEVKVSDENIINTINLANRKHTTDVVGYLIYKILGICLMLISCFFMDVSGSFPTICLLVGAVFLIISTFRLTISLKLISKILINAIYIVLVISGIFLIDRIHSVENEVKPRLYFYHKVDGNLETYNTLYGTYYFCKTGDISTFDFCMNNSKECKNAVSRTCNYISNKL